MASADKPRILLLSLSYEDYFEASYAQFLDRLSEVSDLSRAKTIDAAPRAISSVSFKAIIITDQGLTHPDPTKKEVLPKVKRYIEEGGLAIIGLHFPSFTTPKIFESFFYAFDLPWKSGAYHRTAFQFSPSTKLPPSAELAWLPEPYSMKALSMLYEKMFVPVPGALTESRVDIPEPVDETQAAVLGAKIGLGHLVYCGDVNGERESFALIMALCGLHFST
ncbi:hypothetical protein N7478_006409 [Penicillium angulare]|uniref:uncharacterized protein n=1 Tax=Penicillium angulare TaxID=116970 RepID=UPI002540A350|nr:uncharacterized protein N7478_006409 [Penicillium angulare]KAJ5281037.1 hypothetical protein N7478_006409 [Penicillium angulare]